MRVVRPLDHVFLLLDDTFRRQVHVFHLLGRVFRLLDFAFRSLGHVFLQPEDAFRPSGHAFRRLRQDSPPPRHASRPSRGVAGSLLDLTHGSRGRPRRLRPALRCLLGMRDLPGVSARHSGAAPSSLAGR